MASECGWRLDSSFDDMASGLILALEIWAAIEWDSMPLFATGAAKIPEAASAGSRRRSFRRCIVRWCWFTKAVKIRSGRIGGYRVSVQWLWWLRTLKIEGKKGSSYTCQASPSFKIREIRRAQPAGSSECRCRMRKSCSIAWPSIALNCCTQSSMSAEGLILCLCLLIQVESFHLVEVPHGH